MKRLLAIILMLIVLASCGINEQPIPNSSGSLSSVPVSEEINILSGEAKQNLKAEAERFIQYFPGAFESTEAEIFYDTAVSEYIILSLYDLERYQKDENSLENPETYYYKTDIEAFAKERFGYENFSLSEEVFAYRKEYEDSYAIDAAIGTPWRTVKIISEEFSTDNTKVLYTAEIYGAEGMDMYPSGEFLGEYEYFFDVIIDSAGSFGLKAVSTVQTKTADFDPEKAVAYHYYDMHGYEIGDKTPTEILAKDRAIGSGVRFTKEKGLAELLEILDKLIIYDYIEDESVFDYPELGSNFSFGFYDEKGECYFTIGLDPFSIMTTFGETTKCTPFKCENADEVLKEIEELYRSLWK